MKLYRSKAFLSLKKFYEMNRQNQNYYSDASDIEQNIDIVFPRTDSKSSKIISDVNSIQNYCYNSLRDT